MNWVELIFLYIGALISVFYSSMINCEYRSYDGGHRYVRAFRARSIYQRALTISQSSKDIFPYDLKKLTYIGYFSSIITNISIICFVCISIWFGENGDIDKAYHSIAIGFFICFIFNAVGFFFQIIDSYINYHFPKN